MSVITKLLVRSSAVDCLWLCGSLFSMLCVTAVWGNAEEPKISVKGQSVIRLAADEIAIAASIETRGKTAAQACKENREKSKQLVEFVKSHGIDEKLIQADLVSIDSIYPNPDSNRGKGYSKSQSMPQAQVQSDDNPFGDPIANESPLDNLPQPVGYKALRHFTIVIKDLSKFEEIYQGIFDKGIHRIDNVKYRSSQENDLQEKLRRQAVRDAKSRAESMANELGAKLSSIQSIGSLSTSVTGRGVRSVSPGYGGSAYGGAYGSAYGSDDPFGAPDAVAPDEGPTDRQLIMQASVDVVFLLGNSVFKE